MTNKNGSKWCRPSTRLAIYLRDNLQCVYCLASLEDGAQLTLDHVKPRDHGGTNAARNLVTACLSCNSARQCRRLADWKRCYDGRGEIMRRVRAAQRRVLPRELARTLIELRKSGKTISGLIRKSGKTISGLIVSEQNGHRGFGRPLLGGQVIARLVPVPVNSSYGPDDAAYEPRGPDDYQRTPQGGTFVA